jgi:shikimate kinase
MSNRAQSWPACVLVGAPGSGKTTVGELVAGALGVPFRDTDADITAVAGKPVAEIFVEDGEPVFRDLEHRAVATALADFSGVLALGGGAVLDERTRAALRGHRVVYLAVEVTEAIARIGLDKGRPLLALNPRATLRHLLDQRRPLYEQVATITVDTAGRTAAEAAEVVIAALRSA